MPQSRIIDADAHFMEPDHLWEKYLEPSYRAIAPRQVVDAQGKPRTLLLDQLNFPFSNSYDDTPKARLEAMDREGIDTMIIYPTLGLMFGGLPQARADAVAALCRAHNNWAHDYCSVDPKRLMTPAMVAQVSVEETLKETRRCVEQLGCKGVFLRPNAVGGRRMDDPDWEPLWNLLEELDTPLVIHEGIAGHHPEAGLDRYGRYDNLFFLHMVSHPFEHMMAMMELVCGGVLERHPKLRVLHVEAGCGWLPYWLERMDHHYHQRGIASVELKTPPSDYVKRQCLISADPEENVLPEVVAAVGDDVIAFSTDFPHTDHIFAGMVSKCQNTPGLSDASKQKILGANVARLFQI